MTAIAMALAMIRQRIADSGHPQQQEHDCSSGRFHRKLLSTL
jgi:hypothetical protein